MSEELEPALTLEEWRRGITVREACDRYHTAAVIALANDELSNDSPYKITRADVDYLLNEVAPALENEDVWRAPDPKDESPARRLAAKLAALLPP